MILVGTGISSGRACAPLLIYDPTVTGSMSHRDTGDADRVLEMAFAKASSELTELANAARGQFGAAEAEIFSVQLAMLDDPECAGAMRKLVAEGASADLAVWKTIQALASEIAALEDEYLANRATDVLDLGRRLLRLLGALPRLSLRERASGSPVIVAAHELTPSEMLELDPHFVKGIMTEAGGRNSHTALLARQLGIPAVASLDGLLDACRNNKVAAIDGATGRCMFDPSQDVVAAYSAAPAAAIRAEQSFLAHTADGVAVHVLANAAVPEDVRRAVAFGADGIGLYRTEFLFMGRESLPGEAEQAEIYARVAEDAAGRVVTFRTLDVGGDKPVPSLNLEQEANAFLGIRGIRFGLRNRDLLETQLRALLSARADGPSLQVMVPMVSELEELIECRTLIDQLADGRRRPAFGAMIEVPSAAILAREFAAVCDFLSVGTNDLTQYVLAADRTNGRLASLYNDLHPAVVRVLAQIARDVVPTGTPLGICGDLASRIEATPLLIGLGYRELSVAPHLVGPVKRAVMACSLESAVSLAERCCAARTSLEVSELVMGMSGGG